MTIKTIVALFQVDTEVSTAQLEYWMREGAFEVGGGYETDPGYDDLRYMKPRNVIVDDQKYIESAKVKGCIYIQQRGERTFVWQDVAGLNTSYPFNDPGWQSFQDKVSARAYARGRASALELDIEEWMNVPE